MNRLRFLWVVIVGGLLLLIPQEVHAGWGITYGGELSDYGMWLDQTDDGGYIVTGWTDNYDRFEDMLLVKLNSHGVIEWTRTYGYTDELGNTYPARGFSVRQTGDGGYVITGIAGWDGSNGFWDIWLLKTDSLGDTLWTRVYGSENYTDFDIGYCVQQTSDGGYIVTGEKGLPFSGGGSSIWLLKTDAQGDTLWAREFDGQHRLVQEYGHSVQQTNDGGYILTGTREFALCLIKTDEQGDTLWSKEYDDEDVFFGVGNCVQQTSDSGYIVLWERAGHDGPLGCYNIWLLKTDLDGDSSWVKRYGELEKDERAYCVQQTSDGGYILVGYTGYTDIDTQITDLWLIKTDENGDTMWTKTFGEWGNDFGRCVQQTADGGYIIAGYTESFGSGGYDMWLIKTDSLGEIGVKEEMSIEWELDWQVTASVGPQVVIKYSGHPKGFRASVFDATGRKVDEINAAGSSGTISWGEGCSPGVYFIMLVESRLSAQKVVLTR